MSVAQRCSKLAIVNTSAKNAVVPVGTKLAFFKVHKSTPVAVLTDVPHKQDGVCAEESETLATVSKSVSTDERRTLANDLPNHLSIFDFALEDDAPSILASQTKNRIRLAETLSSISSRA